MKILLLVLGWILFFGCVQLAPGDSSTLNKPFQLKAGESAIFKTENFNITFVKVSEDSRCPKDVVCVWAGQVKLWIRVEKVPNQQGAIYSTEFELVRGPGDSPSEKKLSDYNGEYLLKLLDVRPYPQKPGEISQSDYVITLELDKTR